MLLNLIIIAEATESGDQGYDLILRDEYNCQHDDNLFQKALADYSYSDIFIFPGNYNLEKILIKCRKVESELHIDIAYNISSLNQLNLLQRKFNSIFLSTSSKVFLDNYNGSVDLIKDDLLKNYCDCFVFKENRGGTRVFESSNNNCPIYIESQTRPIVHSVGAGDCFNLVFVGLKNSVPRESAFYYASWIAAEYASTTYIDDFKRGCGRILSIPSDKIVNIPGISLPWEKRPSFNIYIAAPDFDYVDKTEIELIVEKLKYHNFSPRLPVREHGQMSLGAPEADKQKLFNMDVSLIDECSLVLAVLIGDDPGTYIEIGLAAGLKIPVIVYDPYQRAKNLMLTQLPQLVTNNVDSIISEIFTIASQVFDG